MAIISPGHTMTRIGKNTSDWEVLVNVISVFSLLPFLCRLFNLETNVNPNVTYTTFIIKAAASAAAFCAASRI